MIQKYFQTHFQKKNDTKLFWWVTLSAALSAGIVSLWIGMRQSIWFDETYSVTVAQHSIGEIVRLTSLDTHPPLYYILLHWWGDAFNWSELALRVLSILGFSGAIIVAGLLLRKLFGVRVAIVAVGVVAFAPLLIRYGFEIRMYSLASLIGISATYLLVVARERQRWWLWGLYAVLVAIGMYTLYYLAMLWVAHLIWLVMQDWHARRLRKWYRQPWLLAFGGSVILFLPWLPSFLRQAGSNALAPIGQPMNLENLTGVLTFNLVYQPIWQLSMAVTLAVLAGVVALGYLVKRGIANSTKDEKPWLWLLVCYIAVPIAILFCVSFARSMYVERYLSHVAIGLMMLIGVIAGLALRKATNRVKVATGILGVVLLVGVLHVADIGNFNFQRMEKPTVQQVADDLGNCRAGETIVAADPYVMTELSAVLPVSCNLHFYTDAPTLRGGYAPLDGSSNRFSTTEIPVFSHTIKYVYYGEPELTVAKGYALTSEQTFGNLKLAVYHAIAE